MIETSKLLINSLKIYYIFKIWLVYQVILKICYNCIRGSIIWQLSGIWCCSVSFSFSRCLFKKSVVSACVYASKQRVFVWVYVQFLKCVCLCGLMCECVCVVCFTDGQLSTGNILSERRNKCSNGCWRVDLGTVERPKDTWS